MILVRSGKPVDPSPSRLVVTPLPPAYRAALRRAIERDYEDDLAGPPIARKRRKGKKRKPAPLNLATIPLDFSAEG